MNFSGYTNYHTHTSFCDGKDSAASYVEEAIRQQMSALGFSAHAPVTFANNWSINASDVKDYYQEILRLKKAYAGQLEIHCGLEADFFPDILEQVQALYTCYPWDYIIGSIHFIGVRPNGNRWCIDGSHEEFRAGWNEITAGDPLLPIEKYFEYTRQMVRTMKPDIIGHMDKIKIQYRPDCLIPEDHPFYRQQLLNTLEEIASSNCIVEVNTRGIHKGDTDDFYPSRWVIRKMCQMNIPVIVSSDAHALDMLIFGFDRAIDALKDAGYKAMMILKNGKWEEKAI